MEGRARGKSKDTSKKQIDLTVFEEQVKKSYGGKLLEREIVGSFNAIDLEAQGYLEKNNFLYCLTSYINKLLTN